MQVCPYTEATNNFVWVRFDRTEAKFYCNFDDEIKIKTKKLCKVHYGPESPGCRSLPYYLQVEIQDSSSVGGGIVEIGNTSRVCFSVEVSSGTKSVIVEGIYDMDKGKLE